MSERDGWNYTGKPEAGTDARKIVTLVQDGMTWVGIRAWNHAEQCWYNGNDPEIAKIKAWQDLPEPAKGFWYRGQLTVPSPPPSAPGKEAT